MAGGGGAGASFSLNRQVARTLTWNLRDCHSIPSSRKCDIILYEVELFQQEVPVRAVSWEMEDVCSQPVRSGGDLN